MELLVRMMSDNTARDSSLSQAWSTPHPDLEPRKQGEGSPKEGHLLLRAIQSGYSTIFQRTMEKDVRYRSVQRAIRVSGRDQTPLERWSD